MNNVKARQVSRASQAFKMWMKRRSKFATRERIVLALVIVQSLFLQGDHGLTVGGISSAMLLALGLLGWLIDKRKTVPCVKRLQNAIGLFLAITGISVYIGFVQGKGVVDVLRDFMKFGNVFLILLFLRGPLPTEKVLRLLKWMMIVIYIPTTVAFLGKIGINTSYFKADVDYGNQSVPMVLMIIAMLLFVRLPMRNFLAVLLFPPVYTLIVSGTRTYWVGVLSGLAVVYFLKTRSASRQNARSGLFSAMVLAACIYVTFTGFPSKNTSASRISESKRIEQRLEFLRTGNIREDQSLAARFDESSRVIDSIENWVVGNGLGEKVIIDTMEGLGMWDLISTTWFHNAYLFFLLKMGSLGLGAFLVVLFFLFRTGYQAFRLTKGSEQALSAFFIAYLVSALLMSWTTGNFIVPRCWLLLGICGGVLANIRGRLHLSTASISGLCKSAQEAVEPFNRSGSPGISAKGSLVQGSSYSGRCWFSGPMRR